MYSAHAPSLPDRTPSGLVRQRSRALHVAQQVEHRAAHDEADTDEAERRDLVVEGDRLEHVGKGDLEAARGGASGTRGEQREHTRLGTPWPPSVGTTGVPLTKERSAREQGVARSGAHIVITLALAASSRW